MALIETDEEIRFLRDLFIDRLDMSIHTAAKECDRFRIPIHKDLIGRIRRSVRQSLGKNFLEVVPPLPPDEAAEEKTLERPTMPPRTAETREQRIRRKQAFVDDLVLDQPSITPTEITKSVQRWFDGEGIDPRYLLSALRIARELAGIPQRQPPKSRSAKALETKIEPKKETAPVQSRHAPPTPGESATTPKAKIPEGDEYGVSWQTDGVMRFDIVSKAELSTYLIRLQAKDEKNIKVWVPKPFKVRIEVDLGE
jgi:hypothetical protein